MCQRHITAPFVPSGGQRLKVPLARGVRFTASPRPEDAFRLLARAVPSRFSASTRAGTAAPSSCIAPGASSLKPSPRRCLTAALATSPADPAPSFLSFSSVAGATAVPFRIACESVPVMAGVCGLAVAGSRLASLPIGGAGVAAGTTGITGGWGDAGAVAVAERAMACNACDERKSRTSAAPATPIRTVTSPMNIHRRPCRNRAAEMPLSAVPAGGCAPAATMPGTAGLPDSGLLKSAE